MFDNHNKNNNKNNLKMSVRQSATFCSTGKKTLVPRRDAEIIKIMVIFRKIIYVSKIIFLHSSTFFSKHTKFPIHFVCFFVFLQRRLEYVSFE